MQPENISLKDLFAVAKITYTFVTDNKITIIGKINDKYAIVIVSQPSLTFKNMTNMVQNSKNEKCTLKNDIFSCYELENQSVYNFRLIYPADEDKVRKYTLKNNEYKRENYKEYESYLSKKLVLEKDNNWIRNIIESCQNNYDEDKTTKKYKKDLYDKQKQDSKTFTLDNENNVKNNDKSKLETIDATNTNIEECNKKESAEIKNDNETSKDNHVVTHKISEIKEDAMCNEIGKDNLVVTHKTNENKEDAMCNETSKDDHVVTDKINEIKEEILYNDGEFVIIPNYKWNQKSINNLYLILLFKEASLYTIREVKSYELLERAKKAIYYTIKSVYGLDKNDVYLFFHYHPTYFSLHMHICNVNFHGPFSSVGKAILVDDVIENIKLDKNFYEKRDMFLIVKKDS